MRSRAQQEACQKKAAAFEKQAASLRQTAQEKGQRLKKGEDEYRRLRGDVDAASQRMRVLQSMEQEHEGLGRAVKVVLTASQPWRSRLCGAVGELCQIPSRFAVAIDVALGGAVRYVVAEDERAAKQAISYLKDRKAGRTTFLPWIPCAAGSGQPMKNRLPANRACSASPPMLFLMMLNMRRSFHPSWADPPGRYHGYGLGCGPEIRPSPAHRLPRRDAVQRRRLPDRRQRPQSGRFPHQPAGAAAGIAGDLPPWPTASETTAAEGRELRRQAEESARELAQAEDHWRKASQAAEQARWQGGQEEKGWPISARSPG